MGASDIETKFVFHWSTRRNSPWYLLWSALIVARTPRILWGNYGKPISLILNLSPLSKSLSTMWPDCVEIYSTSSSFACSILFKLLMETDKWVSYSWWCKQAVWEDSETEIMNKHIFECLFVLYTRHVLKHIFGSALARTYRHHVFYWLLYRHMPVGLHILCVPIQASGCTSFLLWHPTLLTQTFVLFWGWMSELRSPSRRTKYI